MSKTAPLTRDTDSAICWGAIFAGAFAAAAMTLILVALGTATGLSMVTPWSDSGVTAGTFKIAVGAYLVLTAIIASVVGGYIAGRLRTRWFEASRQEVLFRDTAHGMVTWAVATIGLVMMLGAGTGALVTAGTAGLAHGASQGATSAAASKPTDYYVDMLLRPGTGTASPSAQADPAAQRREVSSIFARSFAPGGKLSSADQSYLTQIVAQRSGISQSEAERRVTEVTNQTKAYVDSARKYAIAFALWVTVALFAGAFAAAAGAIEGGQLRDGRWRGVLFAPRNEVRTR